MTTTATVQSTTTFRTREAYISGGICGHLWMPSALAGQTIRKSLRGPFGIMDRFTEPATFRDALLLLLCEDGGDFQDARFTADTEIVIIRERVVGNGRRELHTRTRTIAELADCADLVSPDCFIGDFFGEDE